MTQLWPHQSEALEFAGKHAGTLLAMAMGTGKSAVVVRAVEDWQCDRVLVVAPKSVLAVWPKQFDTHRSRPARVEILKGATASAKAARLSTLLATTRGRPLVVVLNYESAWRDKLREALLNTPWDLVVLDESHRIKGPSSKASWFAKALGRRVPKRLGLTGTPMPNSPLDLYAQFRFLDPSIFGTSFAAFRHRYAVMGGFENRQVVRWQNQIEMRAKMASRTYRAEASVLTLPEAIHVYRTCTLSKGARSTYDSMEQTLVADIGSGLVTAQNGLVRLLRLQQLTGGWLTDDAGEDHQLCTSKKDLLVDILQDIEPTEPVVVFCRFRRDLNSVAEACRHRDVRRAYLELSGANDQLAQWQAIRGGQVLAVQIQAGGLGVDLTRARYCLYYSLGFSLGDYEQSLARVLRPGQERPVCYIHLVAEDTVDEKLYQALEKKAKVVDYVMEGLTHD